MLKEALLDFFFYLGILRQSYTHSDFADVVLGGG